MYDPADASTRLALELDQEIQDLAIKMKEHEINSENRDQQCSSDEPVVDLVISAAMTPPYPYGYGAEYVARCACPPPFASFWWRCNSADGLMRLSASGLQGLSERVVSTVSLLLLLLLLLLILHQATLFSVFGNHVTTGRQ
jgi:hypothetical protein